jgi:RNA polymerase sigma-70 factor (ECF subfamily)
MPDSELIAQVARGQPLALGALYDRYGGLLLSVLMRVLRDGPEAEDVLHEVFLEVWQHAADFEPARGNVRSWLVMRTRSRGLDRLRALGRIRTVGERLDAVGAQAEAVPADALTVRCALSNLAPELRRLLELGYFQGMSSAEMAEHEGLALGTVKSRVARALAELREFLGPIQ